MIYGGPGARIIRYLFIDGAALSTRIARVAQQLKMDLPIDYGALCSIDGGVEKIFYYDALPTVEDGESDTEWEARTSGQRELLEKLELTDRFHVFEGDARRKGGERKGKREQKKVDIAIAVDMLSHAYRRNMDQAILITGDLDFQPLLAALTREGMSVTLYHPPHATKELLRAASIRRLMDFDFIWTLVDRNFAKTVSFPSSEIGPEDTGGTLIDRVSDGDQQISYRHDGSRFVLSWPLADGNCFHHRSADERLLLTYAMQRHGFDLQHLLAKRAPEKSN